MAAGAAAVQVGRLSSDEKQLMNFFFSTVSERPSARGSGVGVCLGGGGGCSYVRTYRAQPVQVELFIRRSFT